MSISNKLLFNACNRPLQISEQLKSLPYMSFIAFSLSRLSKLNDIVVALDNCTHDNKVIT